MAKTTGPDSKLQVRNISLAPSSRHSDINTAQSFERAILQRCHQSVSLAARALETNGIATIVMGCAKDIVEFVGVPRFLFSDFPLGNAAGRPNDPGSLAATLQLALAVLERAPGARTTVQSPLVWGSSPDWKLDYQNIDRISAEEIARRRAEFDRGKATAKTLRETANLDKPAAPSHDPLS